MIAGVILPVQVQHVLEPVKVRVLWHLPGGVGVGDVDAAPLHLLVELVLGVAGGALEADLACLQRCLLYTVAVEGPAAARRHEATRPRAGRGQGGVQAHNARGVRHHVRGLLLDGRVVPAEAVHVVPEDKEVFGRCRGAAREVVVLLALLDVAGDGCAALLADVALDGAASLDLLLDVLQQEAVQPLLVLAPLHALAVGGSLHQKLSIRYFSFVLPVAFKVIHKI